MRPREIIYQDKSKSLFVEKYKEEVIFSVRRGKEYAHLSVLFEEYVRQYEEMDDGKLKVLEGNFHDSLTRSHHIPGYGADEESEVMTSEEIVHFDIPFKIYISKSNGKLKFNHHIESVLSCIKK